MGFVGSHLCEQFLNEKHNVIILTRSFIKNDLDNFPIEVAILLI